jgi:hypothetical protein
MAKLLCQLHWDPKKNKVVKTYQVLSTGPKDTIQFTTRDSRPFLIDCKNARLAKQLGLEKAPNVDGHVLYKVGKAAPPAKTAAPSTKKPARLPSWLLLKCGTLGEDGKFESWGGVGPDGPNS